MKVLTYISYKEHYTELYSIKFMTQFLSKAVVPSLQGKILFSDAPVILYKAVLLFSRVVRVDVFCITMFSDIEFIIPLQ